MNKKERAFIKAVWGYYHAHGRHDLPWRQTTSPYHILVSEIMLQQTQVVRVLPKYTAFVQRWPTARALARAPLAAVLTSWQGLGYNRRAKLLHECVQYVELQCNSTFPKNVSELQKLPGVGPYTAGAIIAFAFNQPVAFVETNIRTVYIHHFFKTKTAVDDKDLVAIIARTLDSSNPREWYWALMDYGTHLKKTYGSNTKQSRHYIKQTAFKGSVREVRGAILRIITTKGQLSHTQLQKHLARQFDDERFQVALVSLLSDGLIIKNSKRYVLPGVNEKHSYKNTTYQDKSKDGKN